METLRIIEHGNGHTDIEALIYGEWVVVKCILEDTMPKTDKFSLYEERGELLDIANELAINELPFTLAPQLQEMNEQIRLIENITADNQRVYFSNGSAFETLTKDNENKQAKSFIELAKAHQERVKANEKVWVKPENCQHEKARAIHSGMRCNECRETFPPRNEFEQRLVNEKNPRSSGYVNWKMR